MARTRGQLCAPRTPERVPRRSCKLRRRCVQRNAASQLCGVVVQCRRRQQFGELIQLPAKQRRVSGSAAVTPARMMAVASPCGHANAPVGDGLANLVARAGMPGTPRAFWRSAVRRTDTLSRRAAHQRTGAPVTDCAAALDISTAAGEALRCNRAWATRATGHTQRGGAAGRAVTRARWSRARTVLYRMCRWLGLWGMTSFLARGRHGNAMSVGGRRAGVVLSAWAEPDVHFEGCGRF